MNLIGQGLLVSLLGMGITFATLGILIFLIHILRFVFPADNFSAEEDEPLVRNTSEAERRAAICAALWYWQNEQYQSSDLGKRLEQPQGPWQTSNQDQIIK